MNAEYEASASGPTFSAFEIAAALAYSFIRETGEGIAPARPNQTLVPTLSVKTVYGAKGFPWSRTRLLLKGQAVVCGMQ